MKNNVLFPGSYDICKLELEWINTAASGMYLCMRMRVVSKDLENWENGEVTFFGVSSLRFLSPNVFGCSGTHILVEDISDNQWEDIKYKIIDIEEELFEFYCRQYVVNYY
ncbi:hypothetical protein KDL29_10325 [bacterium]|nr:hypothetical protein [bacterium]